MVRLAAALTCAPLARTRAAQAYEAALNAAGVQNAIHVYRGTGHDFADESVAARYQKDALP